MIHVQNLISSTGTRETGSQTASPASIVGKVRRREKICRMRRPSDKNVLTGRTAIQALSSDRRSLSEKFAKEQSAHLLDKENKDGQKKGFQFFCMHGEERHFSPPMSHIISQKKPVLKCKREKNVEWNLKWKVKKASDNKRAPQTAYTGETPGEGNVSAIKYLF